MPGTRRHTLHLDGIGGHLAISNDRRSLYRIVRYRDIADLTRHTPAAGTRWAVTTLTPGELKTAIRYRLVHLDAAEQITGYGDRDDPNWWLLGWQPLAVGLRRQRDALDNIDWDAPPATLPAPVHALRQEVLRRR